MGFIYVGRLDELKGIKVMLEAWKRMENTAPELVICGDGPLADWCKRFIINNHIKKITMKGHVSNQEAKKLIAKSQALILPTLWYEGFPMTIIESYSVGTPVICSNMGNVAAIVEEGVTGWKFTVGSVEELIGTIYKWSNISEKVIKVYTRKYSAEINYLSLAQIYDRCTLNKLGNGDSI